MDKISTNDVAEREKLSGRGMGCFSGRCCRTAKLFKDRSTGRTKHTCSLKTWGEMMKGITRVNSRTLRTGPVTS